uniref:Uncharacterized protein n=2 Tax=Cacopsylla melanoneura TaxID=428564 RepID=A0A8D8XRG8_9HEMI
MCYVLMFNIPYVMFSSHFLTPLQNNNKLIMQPHTLSQETTYLYSLFLVIEELTFKTEHVHTKKFSIFTKNRFLDYRKVFARDDDGFTRSTMMSDNDPQELYNNRFCPSLSIIVFYPLHFTGLLLFSYEPLQRCEACEVPLRLGELHVSSWYATANAWSTLRLI